MNKKIIASVLAVAFAVSMAGSAGAVVTDAQYQALLNQFNQLTFLYNQLLAQTSAQTDMTGLCLTSNLSLGMSTDEVQALQQGLNQDPATQVAVSGAGSPGFETSYFGPLTLKAIKAFQLRHGIMTSGYLDATTRAKFNTLYCFSPIATTITTAPTTTSLPDLTISNITADKTTLNIGQGTRILATEKNIGNNSAGYHNTGVFEDNIETPLGSMEINTIAPGYSPIINVNYTCYKVGSHTITALADFIHKVPTGEVAESNENNNSKTITINCIASPISTTTTAPSNSYIKVISPNGGEQWVSGQTYNITWQSNGINNVKLAECAETPLLSTKYTCQELSGIPSVGINAALGKLSWHVDPNDPFIPGMVKIKIWDVSNPSVYDESDNYFSIVSLADPKVNLTIDPSSIYEGQSTTIIWSASPINNISYCRASGGSGDWFGIKAASGREIIHPVRSNYKDYVLSCFDKDGRSTSASAGVAILSTTITTTCVDSDGGDNIYIAGFVTGNYYPTVHSEVLSHGTGTGLTKRFTDYCENSNTLKEFYCVSHNVSTALSSGNEIVDVSYSCPSGYTCQDGACKSHNLPDLTILNITVDKTTLNIGETTKISATEANIGNVSAGHHYTGIFEDNVETPLNSMEINAIAPGYSPIINVNYTCYKVGSHTITALADFIHQVPTGEVAESNENNNSKTITINCVTSTTPTCTDSDNGRDYYTKGTAIGEAYWQKIIVNETDSCYNCNNLAVKSDSCVAGPDCCVSDWYCNEYGKVSSASLNCPNGCSNGACKPAATVSVDLKVNGSDNTTAVPYASTFNVSWTSIGATTCSASGHYITSSRWRAMD